MLETQIQIANVWPGMMFELSRIMLVWPLLIGMLIEWPVFYWLTNAKPLASAAISLSLNLAAWFLCIILMAFIDVLWFLCVSFAFSLIDSAGMPGESMWTVVIVGGLAIDWLIATLFKLHLLRRFLSSHYAYLHALRQPSHGEQWLLVGGGTLLSMLAAVPAYLQFQQNFLR